MADYPHLLAPLDLGFTTLPNRVLLYSALPGLITAVPTIPVSLVPGYYAEELGLALPA